MNTSKKSILLWPLLALLVVLQAAPLQAQSARQPIDVDTLFNCTWSAATVYPIPILDNAAVSVGGVLYSFGGVSNNSIIANAYKFDGTTWTAITSLPAALEFPTAVTDGTSIYILGGADTTGTPVTTLYKYDPVGNTYTTLAPFTTGTWNTAVVYLNGKLYKFCGSASADSTSVLEIYTISSNTWTTGASYPLALSFVSAWAQGNFIYAAGGIQAATTAPSAKTYRYDPVGNTWDDASIADLPATRWAAASALYTDAVLAGGYVAGTTTGTISTTAISWDMASNTWQTLPALLGERSRMGGAVLNGSFYVIGGRSVASSSFVGTNDNQKLLCLNTPTNIISGNGSFVSSAGANGVLDPGETVTVLLGARNTGGPGTVCTTASLTGTLQATGGVTSPSGPQVYGSLCSGAVGASRSFTFTVDPALACGSTVTASLVMTDGATNYGTVTYTFTLGSVATVFAENFDGVTAPALPAGWTTTFSGSGTAVATSTTFPDTAPNDIFLSESTTVGLSEATSPSITITGPGQKLSFRNLYNTESTFDGLVLEISIPSVSGGAFQDILTAGGTFASGGYNSTLSTGFSNPLPGRMAWTGLSGGTAAAPTYITTVVNLPAAAVGQSVQFKWRQGSDSSVAPSTNPGSRIDSITISGTVCGGNAPAASSVVSRHLHAGTPYDIPIPLGGGGVESRRGSGASLNNHQLVLTFGSPVTYSGATVASSDGLATITPSVSGSTVTLDLTAVADQQLLGVTLTGAKDGSGNVGNVNIPFGVLLGDVSSNGVVNGADTTQVRARAGNSTDATNARYDLNEDGAISSADTTIVRGRAGNSIPTAPESAK